ncbi:uncharacterized protein Gasu_51610 [Galdieria sulphuraria]|uniref:Glycosyltransferase 2-like domain-containing protein n=1 Tax=Galdieria sulphuraria TaxID=130081 RepID=M2XBP5_GALSU|nr:uncharacterized protein Gasu_51610 [Galdieria sulphuraria]EME27307.1 hypothetical protein Gasu_51610 [Galdieria sulphuraria]|eukprot:XP_005703827.1 hypothetical protein Gasu_51610 [Galdieria sulphuraria]
MKKRRFLFSLGKRKLFWLVTMIGFLYLFSPMGRSKYLPPERQRLNEPTRKLPQKADLKSIYSQFQFADSKESTVTVIISCFMRPNSFETVALSFLNQTAPIVDVIAYVSGSPFKEEYLAVVERIKKVDSRISAFVSDVNLGYFGRFQVALQVNSDFVVFADDDVIQGRKTIEAFIKAYRFAGFVGVLGVRGVIYDNIFPAWLKKLKPSVISRKYGTIQSELSFSSTRPTEIQTHWLSSGAEVDTLFSFWFMPSSWVQLLYLEQPVTTLTAEDIYISYIIQKYLEKPTYYLYSDDPDFCGYLSPELGNHNRSWVDVKDELPNITLSQLHDALSSSFVTSNISSRMYRWVRNAVLASLVERGFYLKRMEKLRRRQGRALLIFPSSFEKNNVEQTIVKCMEEPDTSIWILCRQPDCREYVGSSNFLADILDGPYSIIFSNKIFRIILPNQTSRSSYYSRFLMDITALMRSQKISDISVISPDSLELQTLKLAAQLEEVELHVYDSH